MTESWYKEDCKGCGALNWVCNGDESDMSGVDVDGFKCRKCGVITSFDEYDDREYGCNIADGVEFPS